MIIDRKAFIRATDYRELLLDQQGSVFRLREVLGHKNSERMQRKEIDIAGSETEGRVNLERETTRICSEGFKVCEPQD